MNEEAKLRLQIRAALQARNHLLFLQPTDMIAVGEVTERIVTLSARLQAVSAGPSVPSLSDAEVTELQAALNGLRSSIEASAGVSQILAALSRIVQV